MARPRKYTPELAKNILRRLAAGETLRAICREDDMPDRERVRDWVIEDLNGFAASYARAREAGLDEIADETMAISDDGSNDSYRDDEGRVKTDWDVIARSKLRVENRWKYLSKMDRRYGDKTTTELTGADGAPLFKDEDDRARRVTALRERMENRIAQNNQAEPTDASDLA